MSRGCRACIEESDEICISTKMLPGDTCMGFRAHDKDSAGLHYTAGKEDTKRHEGLGMEEGYEKNTGRG